MAVTKEGKAAEPVGGRSPAAQEMDEFFREVKITRPFDMKPIIDGTASVLDEKVQDEICRFVTGTVRLASRKFVIPDVLIFLNGGVRWLYTTVLCGDGIPSEKVSRWESAHGKLKEELARYCAEQARNALVVGSEEAARLWLSAKNKVEQIHAIHHVGDPGPCPLAKSNESLYDEIVDEALRACNLQRVSLDVAALKGIDVEGNLIAEREKWLRGHGYVNEDPLVGKYLAWGAESPGKIPSWCLKVKDGLVDKELIKRNLGVVPTDYDDLFRQLNGNVEAYFAERRERMRDLVDECFCGAVYSDQDPASVLLEKLRETEKGIASGSLACRGSSWHPVLAEALRLPRYRIFYFDWARCHEDEGPSEPGYMFQMPDGTTQEVHYNIDQSEWWEVMDNVEYQIENIIRICRAIASDAGDEEALSQWANVEAQWKMCAGDEMMYHCTGDTDAFAESFYRGVVKMSVLLPHYVAAKKEKNMSDNGYDEQVISIYEAAARRLEGVQGTDGSELPAPICADMLIVTMVDFMKDLMLCVPFYRGEAREMPKRLPSELMLSDNVVFGPFTLMLGQFKTVDQVHHERWMELELLAKRLFGLAEKILGGYSSHDAKQRFCQALDIIRKDDVTGPLRKEELVWFCARAFRDAWYKLGFDLERREQDAADELPLAKHESRDARSSRIAARKKWYERYSPDEPLHESVVKMIQDVSLHLTFDSGLESSAFRFSIGEGEGYTYETNLRTILQMDTRYSYSGDDDVGCGSRTLAVASKWAEKLRAVFFEALNQYCKRRADKCPEDGVARKLWYEAMSMINAGPVPPVMAKDKADEFVEKAHEAARAEWVETKMHAKEKADLEDGVKRLMADVLLQYLDSADSALMFDVNLGLHRNGPSKMKVSNEKREKLIEDFPHQKGEFQQVFKMMEERGIKRHEFVLPNNYAMSRALNPFSEEFFKNRAKAGEYPTSDEYLEKMNDKSASFICAWQCFIDELQEYIDDDALITRIQNIFDGLHPLFKHRLLAGDDVVDLFEYRSLFSEFTNKLLDVSARISARDRSNSGGSARQPAASGAKGGGVEADEIVEKITQAVATHADRTIKAVNKGFGTTKSLINRTWGEGGTPKDKRKPSERRRIDAVVRMYVKKHDIEGGSQCSLLWCCKQVLKPDQNGKHVKELHNAASYDMHNFYDLSAIRAELKGLGKG